MMENQRILKLERAPEDKSRQLRSGFVHSLRAVNRPSKRDAGNEVGVGSRSLGF